MTFSTQMIENKVRELRNMTIDEIAALVLTLEITQDEYSGKLMDAEDRLRDMGALA